LPFKCNLQRYTSYASAAEAKANAKARARADKAAAAAAAAAAAEAEALGIYTGDPNAYQKVEEGRWIRSAEGVYWVPPSSVVGLCTSNQVDP
jgi:hypothetical protein